MSKPARLITAIVAAVGLAGCGSSSSNGEDPALDGHGLQGLILRPEKAAPALSLPNYAGGTVTLSALKGKAVFVTFVYTHCPNVCPLIISDLATADRELGREASHVRMVAVTVDPRRDTPSAVRAFLAARDGIGRVDYLLGSHAALARTWKAWDVAVTVDVRHAVVGHSSIIYGITASGRMAVVYSSSVTPAQIVHDVPLLTRT